MLYATDLFVGKVYDAQVRQVLHHVQTCFHDWINKFHHWIKWDV